MKKFFEKILDVIAIIFIFLVKNLEKIINIIVLTMAIFTFFVGFWYYHYFIISVALFFLYGSLNYGNRV